MFSPTLGDVARTILEAASARAPSPASPPSAKGLSILRAGGGPGWRSSARPGPAYPSRAAAAAAPPRRPLFALADARARARLRKGPLSESDIRVGYSSRISEPDIRVGYSSRIFECWAARTAGSESSGAGEGARPIAERLGDGLYVKLVLCAARFIPAVKGPRRALRPGLAGPSRWPGPREEGWRVTRMSDSDERRG